MYRVQEIAIAVLTLVGSASAWGPPGGWGGDGSSGSNDGYGGYGSGGSSSSGFPGFSGQFGAGFDVQKAERIRTVHGVLAAIAFVIIFPFGAIFMRLVPGRFAIWIHGLTQIIGYAAYIAAAGLGFYMIKVVRIPNGQSLLSNSSTNYHPIIGIVVFALLVFQPLFGFIHHYRFKRVQRRQGWSHLHIWNGRTLMILGIVNGGLGLKLANALSSLKIAYAVVAAVIGAVWLLVAVISELRRSRRTEDPVRTTRSGRRQNRRRQDRTEKIIHRSPSQ